MRIFGVENIVAIAVDDASLAVHDIVVFEDVFTRKVVALFDFLLCVFNGLVEPWVLQLLAFFEAETLHHFRHPFGGTELHHELILEADVENGGTRVALTRTTSAQLAINTAAAVAFGSYDHESAFVADSFAQLDVGSSTGHVGCNGNGARLTGSGDDLGFLHVEFRVENGVGDFLAFEHSRQYLGRFDARRSEQNGLLFGVRFLHQIDNGLVLLALGFENFVVEVDPRDGAVRWYD